MTSSNFISSLLHSNCFFLTICFFNFLKPLQFLQLNDVVINERRLEFYLKINIFFQRPRFEKSEESATWEIFDIVSEPTNKAVIFGVSILITAIHNNYRSGRASICMLDENINNVHVGLAYKPFSPFLETMNEKTVRLVEAGLIEYWLKDDLNYRRKINEEEIGPQVLTMDHLEVGFIICTICLAVGLLAFLVEVSISAMKKSLRILLNFTIAPLMVRIFVENYSRQL